MGVLAGGVLGPERITSDPRTRTRICNQRFARKLKNEAPKGLSYFYSLQLIFVSFQFRHIGIDHCSKAGLNNVGDPSELSLVDLVVDVQIISLMLILTWIKTFI